jgi:hypothetical protein
MFGLGTTEAGIILVLVVLLFAPTLVAFWLGYVMGQRKAAPDGTEPGEQGGTPDSATNGTLTETPDAHVTGGDEAPDA